MTTTNNDVAQPVGDYACNFCDWKSTDTSRPLSRGTKVGCPACEREARFVGTHVAEPAAGVELERCPFCPDGGKPELHDTQFGCRVHDIAVQCRQCGSRGAEFGWASGLTHLQDQRYAEARTKAVIAWNTRDTRTPADVQERPG